MGRLTARRVGDLDPGLVLAPERYDARRDLGGGGARLGDLFQLVSDAHPRGEPALVLDTTHARDGFVDPGRAVVAAPAGVKRRLRAGDVIVSRLRPYLRQIAWVDEGLFAGVPGVAASTEFYVLRARGDAPAAALVPLLLAERVQEALAAAQEGGHHPRVPRRTIEDLPLPAWWRGEAPALAARVEAAVDGLRRLTRERQAIVDEVSARVGAPG